MSLGGLIALAVAVVIAASALGGNANRTGASPTTAPRAAATRSPSPKPTLRPSPTLGGGVVKIGLTLPLVGAYADEAGAIRDGVLLAVKDEAAIPGASIQTVILDHGTTSGVNEDKAVANMAGLIGDQSVVGVVGPETSGVAYDQIPDANRAGLLQCSPSSSWPGLTKGREAVNLRPARPNYNAFLRVVTPDDDQGAVMADFAIAQLGRKAAVVVGDGTPNSVANVDSFTSRWHHLGGGKIVATTSIGTGLQRALDGAAASKPDVVFLAGDQQGAVSVRRAMAKAGLASVPLLASEDVAFASDDDPAAFVSQVGADPKTYAAASYSYRAPGYDVFAARFFTAYGKDPGTWSLGAYACTQVIIEAIREAASIGALGREAVRKTATDHGFLVDTVLGRIGFNPAGDMVPGQIAIYHLNAALKEWEFTDQYPVAQP